MPGAVVGGLPASDTTITNHPVNILSSNAASPTYDVEVYSGLLNISASGTYSFEQRNDDEGEIVIDGAPIHLVDNTGGGGGFGNAAAVGTISLRAGLHQITIRHENLTGASGIQVMYSGPDTLNAGATGAGWANIPSSQLYYSTALTGSSGGSYLNAAQINNNISLVASASATIDAGGSEFNSSFGSMSLGNSSALTVNNLEGSGYIGIQGLTVAGSNATLNPNSGMLYLMGGVSDSGNGLIKSGQGTLILGGSGGVLGGSFSGSLAINSGYVQVASPNALTSGTTTVGSTAAASGATLDLNGTQNVAGTILLNGSGPTPATVLQAAALYNSNPAQASLAAGSLVLIGTSISGLNPSIGGYGDIVINGNIADGPTAGLPWSKVGPDTLTLAGSNTFTGPLTVSMGVLALGSSNAFGSISAGTVTLNAGTTLDLAGQNISATAKTLVLNGAGLTGYAMNNTLAGLINSAAGTTSTYAGAIALGSATNIGANTYNSTALAGNIVLSGSISGNQNITKVGADNLIFTGTSSSTGVINVSGGTVTLEAAFAQATVAVGSNDVYPGATLLLDNTPAAGGPVNNRLGGRAVVNGGGVFLIRGGTTGTSTTEMVTGTGDNFNVGGSGTGFGNGLSIFTLDAGAGGVLTVGTSSSNGSLFTQQNSGTALIRGSSLGQNPLGTAGSAVFMASGATTSGGTAGNGQVVGQTGIGGVNMLIYPWAVADTSVSGNGIGFATYGTNGIRPLNFSTDGIVNALNTNDNVQLTSGVATTSGSGVYSLNSLTLGSTAALGSGTATINAGSTITLQSGGLLALGGTSTIGGSGALSTSNNAQLFIHAPNPNGGGTTQLNVNVPILNTSGAVTKSDGGVAAFGVTQYYTGQTNVNGGTLRLAPGASPTLYLPLTTGNSPGNYSSTLNPQNTITMMVNYGGTLDLNGNTQTVVNLTNANPAMNAAELPLSGGTVTNSSGTTATLGVLVAGNNLWFGGSINGNVNLAVQGGWTYNLESPNTLSGTTTKVGGDLNLVDLGTLQNTTAVYLNGGGLWWNDTGTQAMSTRLSTSASINMNAGAFNYSARSGTQGSITVGALNLFSGASLVNVVPNNGGATINFNNTSGSIARSVGTSINFTGLNSDGIGDDAHVFFSNALPISSSATGGLVGAWATANQFDPATGVYQPGFATYTAANGIGNINPNLVPIATGSVPAGVNARMNGNVTLSAGGGTLNTLSMLNAAMTLSFAASTDQLVVTTGGILTGFDNNNRTIGQSANFGQITAGPGQSELFLHNGAATLTVNSSIVNNNTALNVVIDNLSLNGNFPVTLAGTNSYTGTTYINGPANLNATGGPSIPGNLVINSAVYSTATVSDGYSYTVNFNQANQIASTGSVTLNGGTVLAMNSFSNTINNLTLNNVSGEQGQYPATVVTGMAALTVTGSVSVAANSNTFFVPVINGMLTMSNTTNPTISVVPNTMSPLQVGLQMNAGLTLSAPTTTPLLITGSGVVAIGGQSQYANATSVAAGTTLAFGTAGTEIGNSQVILAPGATLDTRAVNGTIGSLTGSGTVTNYSPTTGGTLVTGLDNTSTTFSGALVNPFLGGLLNVTKVGAGNFNLSANNSGTNLNSPNLGSLTVSGGSVTLNSASAVEGFTGYTLNAGGALVLDNSVNNVANRLGGSYELVAANVATPTTTLRTLTFQGGALTVLGNLGGGTVTENLGNVNIGIGGNGGGGILTLSATNTGGVNVTINGTVSTQTDYVTLLIRGDNLGSSAGTNTATVSVPIAGNINYASGIVAQGSGTNSTTTMSIRPDIIVDPSATGSGTSFAVRDTTSGLIRPLNASSELAASVAVLSATTNTVNAGFTTAQTMLNSTNLNSLTLSGSGGIANLGGAGAVGLSGSLATLTINTGGILASGGTTSIGVGAVTSAGMSLYFHVAGAGTVLQLNSPIINTTMGVNKADSGTLVINVPQYYTGTQGTQINGGLLQLNGGNNTILAQPTATVPTLLAMGVNGGTLDLDGNNQAIGNLTSVNALPGAGGTITNSSTAVATFIVNPAAAGTFAGTVSSTGSLIFDKQGANTLTLTGTDSSAGATNVEGGTLTLRDGGAITAGTVNVNYATLNIDNTGLFDNLNRLAGSTITMNGATLTATGRQTAETINFEPGNRQPRRFHDHAEPVQRQRQRRRPAEPPIGQFDADARFGRYGQLRQRRWNDDRPGQ